MGLVNRIVVIGLIGIGAIALALGLTFWGDALDEASLKEATQAPETAPELRRDAASGSGRQSNPDTEKENSSLANKETLPKEEATPKVIVPSFDVVRVNPAGDAVIAGRAAPGAKISIKDDGEVIGTVVSDRNGEWVFVPEKPLPSGNRSLSVCSQIGEEEPIRSEDVVVLAVPERTPEAAKPLAVLVPRDRKETKKILQRPREPETGRNIVLTLDVVDYDENGRLRLIGRANIGNNAVVYLNNALIGQTVVAEDGNWELKPEQPVEPGLYTLRVDELAQRKVVARVELPFSRAAPLTDLQNQEYIIVQPGNSLWRISRRILGQGTMFSVIYEANKDQIRDADLIYPGQVFAIPKTN